MNLSRTYKERGHAREVQEQAYRQCGRLLRGQSAAGAYLCVG
jgi:hypothetical protein